MARGLSQLSIATRCAPRPCIRPPCPVPRSLYPIGREGLFSPPEGPSAALLLFRLTKGGYAWSVARGIIHSSETAWNARTNSVRVCSKPPRPLSPASLQEEGTCARGCPCTHIHAHSHTLHRESPPFESVRCVCSGVCRFVCKGFNKENAVRVFVVYFGVWLFWLLVNRILCDQLSTMDAYA